MTILVVPQQNRSDTERDQPYRGPTMRGPGPKCALCGNPETISDSGGAGTNHHPQVIVPCLVHRESGAGLQGLPAWFGALRMTRRSPFGETCATTLASLTNALPAPMPRRRHGFHIFIRVLRVSMASCNAGAIRERYSPAASFLRLCPSRQEALQGKDRPLSLRLQAAGQSMPDAGWKCTPTDSVRCGY
jgi:hypothetical protein